MKEEKSCEAKHMRGIRSTPCADLPVEEEEEILKSVRQELDADERADIGEQYFSLYEQFSKESMAA